MRFLADMGVHLQVVEWLRREGHDVVHLRDEGLQRLPNGAIFDKAISENRVILTFDLDFGEIAALSRTRKASVILFRLHNARGNHVMSRLAAILDASKPALEKGAVILVEEARHRVRYLPVGETGS